MIVLQFMVQGGDGFGLDRSRVWAVGIRWSRLWRWLRDWGQWIHGLCGRSFASFYTAALPTRAYPLSRQS